MTASPAISLVLPVHNGARFLDESIRSVVAQSYRDWELILVDDASTDQSPAIIDDWVTRDERIRAVTLCENRRLPGALNAGFRGAAGRWFTWTSDDNRYHADALARMAAVLEAKPQVAVVYADLLRIGEDGAPIDRYEVRPVEQLATGNGIGACFLYRREVHESLGGYDESVFLAEDYDFWLRASNRFRFEVIREPLYEYRMHGGSLTASQTEAVSLAVDRAVARWLPTATWLSRRNRAMGYLHLAGAAFRRGATGVARTYLLRAIAVSRRPLLFPGYRSRLVDLVFGSRVGDVVRSLRDRGRVTCS